MKALLIGVAIATLVCSAADAAKRNVYINKPSPPIEMQALYYTHIPPLLVAFDLIRRTSCDPAIAVSTGKGDPGFDPDGPKYGNFLIPAIVERCATRPQPRR